MKRLHNMAVISFKQFLVKSGLKHIAVGETILTIPQETNTLLLMLVEILLLMRKSLAVY